MKNFLINLLKELRILFLKLLFSERKLQKVKIFPILGRSKFISYLALTM